MNASFRRVYNALAGFDGATVLELASETGLYAAQVVAVLDGLIARGWVRRSGELFYQTSPRVASVDQVITRHVRRGAVQEKATRGPSKERNITSQGGTSNSSRATCAREQ